MELSPQHPEFDVIVVGGAAAGLTAAMYCGRRTLKTLVITKSLGGQAALAPDISNYPGLDTISGVDLMAKFLAQAQKFGVVCEFDTINKITKNGDFFVVSGLKTQHTSSVVILAFGLTPRNLDAPGEQELTGRGVSYCASCDAPLYKGKKVAVVGATYEALDAALLLAKLNASVVLICERDGYPAQKQMFEQAKNSPQIKILLKTKVLKVEGDQKVTGLVVENENGDKETIPVDGVFVERGHHIDSSWLGDLVEYDKGKAIVVDEEKMTKTPGLFAAGDVTTLRDKQVIISAGDGAQAALACYRYVQKLRGKPATLVDWGDK